VEILARILRSWPGPKYGASILVRALGGSSSRASRLDLNAIFNIARSERGYTLRVLDILSPNDWHEREARDDARLPLFIASPSGMRMGGRSVDLEEISLLAGDKSRGGGVGAMIAAETSAGTFLVRGQGTLSATTLTDSRAWAPSLLAFLVSSLS